MENYLEQWEICKPLLEELKCLSGIEHIEWKHGDIFIYVSYSGYDAVNKAFELQALGWTYVHERMQKEAADQTLVAVLFK